MSVAKTKPRKGRFRGRRAEADLVEEVASLIGDGPYRDDLLIEYLHQLQDHYLCLPKTHLVALADCLGRSMAEIFEVATFYHHFDVVDSVEQAPAAITVRVCDSVTCEMFGAGALEQSLKNAHLDNVRIQKVPCVGRCDSAPIAVVGQNPVNHADSTTVIAKTKAGAITPPPTAHLGYRSYREAGGYELAAACRAGEHDAEQIIETLSNAKLRGLGGAGFPAGTKWSILRDQPAPRLMAINIDEGEPGTFKDRTYLEADPHRFLEGMLIAQWAVDAEACYIYLRDEYASCRNMLTREIAALQSDPPFELPTIELRRGAGAYICGEESAMIESIEGKRGLPRLRPPYVAQVGLFGRPTLEHNMETLFWVRDIVERGADWFAGNGRRDRHGLRSFSVSGRVKKPGVHVAPAGISLRELVNEYCGGMLPGHKLYAYFPGGASGGILPASLADEPLDFDTLQPHGSFIGSAAVIVLSHHDSVKHAALNAMRFFKHESCGQCTPCRVGTAKAAELMALDHWDKSKLEDLARAMEDASICGLGQAAPNPLRCALRYFPQEFQGA
ncbi:MAG: NADH-ubiquinone oxidoreductase-F iron-sulfur binding region domain-containing protein [Pseudomonadota bacterium]